MVSVLIADDHSLVREGLRRILERETDLEICGEANDGREVLEQMKLREPDVLVLDISMPGMGGLETLERVRTKRPSVKVILLSVHGDPPLIQSAVSLGADAYVLKTAPATELLMAVRAVLSGDSYFSPAIAREILTQLRSPQRKAGRASSSLSDREREVLDLIADGLSARQIAARLSVSTKTVEAHRTSLMRKLGARKATELVRSALRRGLISP